MAVDQTILDMLRLNKGDLLKDGSLLSRGQFRRRIHNYIESQWPRLDQLNDPEGFEQWQATLLPTARQAEANFAFNQIYARYLQARARIDRYRKADGRPAETMDRMVGLDADGDPIMETVITLLTIDPLPAMIDGQPNPEIVADDAERAAAQAVIDAAPQDLIDFAQGAD